MTPASRGTAISSAVSSTRAAAVSSTRAVLLALLILLVAWPAAIVNADPTPTPGGGEHDPALEQTVSESEKEVHGVPAVIDHGHVDLGPRVRDGHFTLQARDDSVAPPVWRDLDDVVFRVHDAARTEIPQGDEYAFTHATEGQSVYAIPQTEIPGVVWMGWSTQDPPMTKHVSRGITLRLLDVQGPGDFTLFLQPGNFGPPQLLWDGSAPKPRDIWVDLNTHTHATWVFTKPGVYLMSVQAVGEGVDGRKVTDTRTLRFAVGDATSTEQARAAAWDTGRGPQAAATHTEAPTTKSTRPSTEQRQHAVSASRRTLMIGALIAVAVILILGIALLMSMRRRKALESDVWADRSTREEPGEENSGTNPEDEGGKRGE